MHKYVQTCTYRCGSRLECDNRPTCLCAVVSLWGELCARTSSSPCMCCEYPWGSGMDACMCVCMHAHMTVCEGGGVRHVDMYTRTHYTCVHALVHTHLLTQSHARSIALIWVLSLYNCDTSSHAHFRPAVVDVSVMSPVLFLTVSMTPPSLIPLPRPCPSTQ